MTGNSMTLFVKTLSLNHSGASFSILHQLINSLPFSVRGSIILYPITSFIFSRRLILSNNCFLSGSIFSANSNCALSAFVLSRASSCINFSPLKNVIAVSPADVATESRSLAKTDKYPPLKLPSLGNRTRIVLSGSDLNCSLYTAGGGSAASFHNFRSGNVISVKVYFCLMGLSS